MDRFNVVAGQATSVCCVAFEIDSANELFERRCLKNDLAARVCDDACAVEDDPVVSADEVHKDDWNLRHHRAMRNHRATLAHLAFIERRGVDRNQYFSA